MMPYFAPSMIIWTMITGIVTDSTSVFVTFGRYFVNQRMSFATAVNALLYRNVLIFLHNSVIVLIVFVIFQRSVGPYALLAIPGLCLTIITGFWVSYVVGILSTRYRDLGQFVTSLMQIAFFVTPVLWKIDFIPEKYRYIVSLNPFASYLSIIRDPILGDPVPLQHWVMAVAITTIGLLLSLPFIGHYHRRVVYWL